ncbi:MAG: hypothetical protein H6647_11290 [Anaerolineales bacterium]|nr:hypothetical protein [Anaerolineae bacterium]MCB9131508.1 hypothetical protein [Anaerolineales bacterium]HRX03009.1 hypothetical protein [Anaerolineae bacterium]
MNPTQTSPDIDVLSTPVKYALTASHHCTDKSGAIEWQPESSWMVRDGNSPPARSLPQRKVGCHLVMITGSGGDTTEGDRQLITADRLEVVSWWQFEQNRVRTAFINITTDYVTETHWGAHHQQLS